MSEKNRFIELGYRQYVELTDDEVQQRYDALINQWINFLAFNKENLELGKDYYVHTNNLFEVIRRCDKRVLYFYVFHGLVEECEYKEIALLCFWINTLKPFMVVKEDSAIYNSPNEMFSLFLILSTIRGAYSKIVKDKEFKYPSDKRMRDILYDFKYCSMSREAMIAFIETLADSYGVGISYILDKDNKSSS